MKFWKATTLLTVSLLILSGCGAQPTPKESAAIDSSLPTVSLTQNGVIIGMKSVAFEWKSITDQRVKGIYVYKKTPSTSEQANELQYLTTIKSRFNTHFVDTNVNPDTKYTYAFQTFRDDADGKKSREVVVNTLPVLQSVSWIHSITDMPRVAKIIWRPHSNEKVKEYVVERKTLEDEKWEKLETINGRLSAEFIDEELNDNYVYMYRLRAVTYDNIISTPSQIVKVITKALPNSIVNIKTTNNLANRVNINWSTSTNEDFAFYHLYRAEKIDGSYELIAKLHNNKFVDKIDKNGKSYFYRVSAVDKDDLESEHAKNSIQGMTLARPTAPAIVEAKLINNAIDIHWSKTDPRSVKFMVSKKYKQGWFKESLEEFDGIKGNRFNDKNVVPDSEYRYTVQSIDKNGISSEPSVEVKIVTPESTQIQKAKVEEIVNNEKEEVITTPVVESNSDVINASQDLDLSGL